MVGNETIKTRSLATVPEIRVYDFAKGRDETIELSAFGETQESALREEAARRKKALNQANAGCAALDRMLYGLSREKTHTALRAEAERRKQTPRELSTECPSFDEILDGLKSKQIDLAQQAEAAKRLQAETAKRLQSPEESKGPKRSFEDILDEIKVEKSVAAQITILQWVKRHSPVPVTSGQIWSDWRDHPDLVSAVDFIGAHILPFWEGAPADQAVEWSISHYNELRRDYPGKRIVIAEFGWPSAGYNSREVRSGSHRAGERAAGVHRARRGLWDRLQHVRSFRPALEGQRRQRRRVLGHVRRLAGAKFAWTGLVSDPDYGKVAGLAVLLGLLLSLPILAKTHATTGEATTLAVAANGVGAWFAVVFAFWNGHYFVTGAVFAFGLGLLLPIPLVFIALARVEEIAAVAFGRKPRRLISGPLPAPGGVLPPRYRSISRPTGSRRRCSRRRSMRRPPGISGLRMRRGDQQHPRPGPWMPIAEHCRVLGERFKFVNAENLAGFKAGALRLALPTPPPTPKSSASSMPTMSSARWLKDLAPPFADPKVGLVQAPQDHRDGERTLMHHAMNGEYSGFFDIGMVQRNEANAIIVHGTMCLIRRAALERAGGWSSDTIWRGHRSRPHHPRQGWPSRTTPTAATAAASCPTPSRPTRSSATAGPMAASRFCKQALAPAAAARAPAHARAEARVRARLAQLAGRGIASASRSRSSTWSGCRSSPSPTSPSRTRS